MRVKETAASASERVGRYQLLDPIGTGPNGTVSRGKVFGVAGFERQFAVKRFHPDVTATPALAAALSTAARAYGGLEHPRIARMSEFGVAQGQTFTAVELVAGLDAMRLVAEARLAGTTLAVGGALALISQAARAVGYAHGRGLAHLGIAPTNVIVTADGDVKVTDFGILAATLPPRPIEVARLANRIAYLAPEQLTGEATSAATDVYVLGVVAYELVTGQRTFRGDTPAQIAQSILGGPPPEPALPRPIVRVLQRCLARSPFERFPDARALADALDAALRVAPVPGTRKDIGSQVKETLDRHAALNDGLMSGVVALNVGTGPVRRLDPIEVSRPAIEVSNSAIEVIEDDVLSSDRKSQVEIATKEFVRPDLPVAGPAPMVGPARSGDAGVTQPDLPRPMTTVPGLAPPPIPVPQGINPPPMPPLPPTPGGASTLLGMTRRPPSQPPPIRVPTIVPSIPPNLRAPSTIPAIAPLKGAEQIIEMDADSPPTITRPEHIFESTTREMPTNFVDKLNEVASRPTEELPPIVQELESIRPTEEMHSHARELVRAEARRATPPRATPTILGIAQSPIEIAPRRPPSSELPRAVTPPPIPRVPTLHDDPDDVPAFSIESAGPRSGAQPIARDPLDVPATLSTPPPLPRSALEGLPAHPQRATTDVVAPRTPPPEFLDGKAPKIRSHRLPWIIAGVVLIAGIGFGGWQLWRTFGYEGEPVAVVADAAAKRADAMRVAAVVVDAASPDKATDALRVAAVADARAIAVASVDANAALDGARVALAPVDAALIATAPLDAARVADAAQLATAPLDAARVAVAADAARVATAPLDAAVAPIVVAPGDGLAIASTPPGAHVFLDGADRGVTPLKLAALPGRHPLALLLGGHELYVAQVDGTGSFTVPLKAVTPSTGPAGIKVIKCKDANRYYITVDGKPTGMMCPTERIEVATGAHTVEVFDATSATTKKFDIVVTDTRLSYRVRLE